MKCPADTLVKLRDDISFKSGAEIYYGKGTAWGAIERLSLRRDETLVVFGFGPSWIICSLISCEHGSQSYWFNTNNKRLKRAKIFGAKEILNPNKIQNVVKAIKDLTKGIEANFL